MLVRSEIQGAAREDHAKAEEAAVRQAVDTCASKGMIILSERYFDRAMHKALWKMARPPHRLCRGTMRARLRPFLLHPRVWRERTALRKHGKGLCVRSPGEGVVRDMTDPSLPLSPLRATSSNRSFKLQLQRMDNINAVCQFEKFERKTGLGAARLIIRKRPAMRGMERQSVFRAVCMLTQLDLSATVPTGRAEFERVGRGTGRVNIVMMHDDGAIHFGSVNFPPWLKPWLRYEIRKKAVALMKTSKVEMSTRAPTLLANLEDQLAELEAATTDGKRPMMYQMKVPNWPALRPIVSPPAAPPPPTTPPMPPPAPPPPTAA